MTTRTAKWLSVFSISIVLLMTAIPKFALTPKMDRSLDLGSARDRGISRTHRRSKVLISLFLMVVLAISMMTVLSLWPLESDDIPSESPAPAASVYVNHHAIHIYGNDGFLESNSSTGISWGSGTESDPYIIEGWSIKVLDYSGISIWAADVHFIIRYCYLYPDQGAYWELFVYYGIALTECPNGTLDSNICTRFPIGIGLSSSGNNTLINNTCSDCAYGISLGSSSNITLINNACDACRISLYSSSGNTLVNNTIIDSGIFIEGSSLSYFNTHSIDTSNTVDGKPVRYYKNQSGKTVPAGAGQVILANCTDFTIENQNLSSTFVGIELAFSSRIGVTNNTCSHGQYGMYLESSDSNTLTNNTCSDNTYGTYLESSSNNTISNNTFSDYRYMGRGICLSLSSNNNLLTDNTCSNGTYGIWVDSSSSITLVNNTMTDSGIFIAGSSLSHFNTHSIDKHNTVNGKPVRYYKNESGMTVPAGAGQVILANCTDFTIENQNLSATVGIELVFSSRTTVTNNTCSNTAPGVYLYSSSGNTLSNNMCSGISLDHADNNTISRNACSHNAVGDGIRVDSSSNCIIDDNNCSSNWLSGIRIIASNNSVVTRNVLCENIIGGGVAISTDSARNRIWNNTFYRNTDWSGMVFQARDDGTGNWWNSSDGYGNYWSDWTTPDYNMDGIVDLPYDISADAGAKDYYPLTTTPTEPIPEFGAAGIVAVIIATVCIFVALRRTSFPSTKT